MRYLLFAGQENNPAGGWSDYRGEAKTIEEAVAAGAELVNGNKWDCDCQWGHIVELDPDNKGDAGFVVAYFDEGDGCWVLGELP